MCAALSPVRVGDIAWRSLADSHYATNHVTNTRITPTNTHIDTNLTSLLESHMERDDNVSSYNDTEATTPFVGYLNLTNLTFNESDVPVGNSTLDCYQWQGDYNPCWDSTNFTNATLEDSRIQKAYWAFVLLIFPFFTVFGNCLVCIAVYRERSLQTATNFFIVSLAIADIAVGILVMPLAVYVEVNQGAWQLGDILCDAWVAFDVMGCTASILNLTAISVDRFIAVTQPIRYAKHKNSKRVHFMLALAWVISIAISSPIALGMNYTEARKSTPELCIFYNSEFLICSSMGSFYIPTVIMILLYWRIFRAIHMRAKKSALKLKARSIENRNYRPPETDNEVQSSPILMRTNHDVRGANNDNSHKALLPHPEGVHLVTTTTDTGETGEDELSPPQDGIREGHVIPNDKSTEFMLSPVSEDSQGETGYRAPTTIEIETQFTSPPPRNLLSPPVRNAGIKNNIVTKFKKNGKHKKQTCGSKSVTKFNFHIHKPKKKKKDQRASSKREKKATTTLAIVLGVFLFCWLPFFTVNVMTAICIKLDVMYRPECDLDPALMSFFVWLGYINSFLNPVIYTIFNQEFRKAFKKILTDCKRPR